MTCKPSCATRLLLAIGALAISASAFAAQPLFLGETQPDAAARRTTDRLAAQRDSASVRVVRANPSVVSAATPGIEVDLGGRRVNLVRENARSLDSGSLVWTGRVSETAPARVMTAREVRHDGNNSAILVRRGNGITGSVRMEGRLF